MAQSPAAQQRSGENTKEIIKKKLRRAPEPWSLGRFGGLLSRRVLLVLPVLHEIIDHRGVGQGRGVAEAGGFILRDLAQDAAHDLARTRFRQARRKLNEIRRGDWADVLA